MKAREERRKVLVSARMRHGAEWKDVRIVDISTRGLCLHTCNAPARGSYVELRRGRQQIVARVVWAGDGKFGVLAQGRIAIDAVVSDPDRLPEPPPAGERRREPRIEQRAERSRFVGRGLQGAFLALVGATSAVFAAGIVKDALAYPLTAVSSALSPASATASER